MPSCNDLYNVDMGRDVGAWDRGKHEIRLSQKGPNTEAKGALIGGVFVYFSLAIFLNGNNGTQSGLECPRIYSKMYIF